MQVAEPTQDVGRDVLVATVACRSVVRLADPDVGGAVQQTLEVLRSQDGRWLTLAVHRGPKRVRAEPFEAIELDLGVLWANIAPPPRGSRASEPVAESEP